VCLVSLSAPAHGELPRLTIALAGHPPPLLLDASGEVRQVGRAGTLLGVFDPVKVHEIELSLAPGQTLLLYTDGVLDAGRAIAPIGEQGLIDLCAEGAALTLEELLGSIEESALGRAAGELRDDIALLGLRLTSAL
jgi:serine phosphatase RsbU (regulator of sigma subunit)